MTDSKTTPVLRRAPPPSNRPASGPPSALKATGPGVRVAGKHSDRIEIDKKAQGQQATQVTILFNKPIGYVSGQAEDGHQPAVTLVTAQNRWRDDNARFFFHPSQLRGLAPAGRLDIDSIGLLVLTQDGR